MPYEQRQLIVIVDDAVAEADRLARVEAAEEDGELDWAELAKGTLEAAVKTLATPGSVVLLEAVKALYKLRDNGLDALAVGRSDASSLSLPLGHPRNRVLYAGHPGEPAVYYPAAQFHHATFDHKSTEAVRLLMSLGATEIDVQHVRGYGSEVMGEAGGKNPRIPADLKARLTRSRSRSREFRFTAKLAGTHEPCVPDGLVWFPREDNWKQIAEGRLSYGLKEFALELRYDDDFSIGGGLKSKAGKAGLELGGKFADYEQTMWVLKSTFK
jgi:hypothetical protein